MGDFLMDQLDGQGKIWVLRGPPSHLEDINRYNGLMDSLEGIDIEITQEDYGSWVCDLGKSLCETFYLNDPQMGGIWSSGADLPPITGEGNNGIFGPWLELGYPSIVAENSPSQAAGVRAAVALLEGLARHKHCIYEPEGWDAEKVAT